jgi:hypothetical protein
MRRPGRRKGTKKTGGRKRSTLNKATLRRREARAKKSAVVVEARETFAETAQQFEDEALGILVEVMRDKAAPPNARVRSSVEIIDRARGKAAPAAEPPHRDFVPLYERLNFYAREDAIAAAERKVVQIQPPKTVRPVELPSGAVSRATTAEDDPFGPGKL